MRDGSIGVSCRLRGNDDAEGSGGVVSSRTERSGEGSMVSKDVVCVLLFRSLRSVLMSLDSLFLFSNLAARLSMDMDKGIGELDYLTIVSYGKRMTVGQLL